MKQTKHDFTIADLTKDLDVTIKGDPNCRITGISPIQQSTPGHVTFLTNALYKKHLLNTEAAAVILSPAEAEDCPVNAIISSNPYYTYSQIARFFEAKITRPAGIHPSAVIGDNTQIAETASIGANCVIGNHVTIKENAIIGAGTTIGDFSTIDEQAELDAHVTIYHHVSIGQRSRIMSGAVIGGDGFGFANQKGAWYKVPQLGGVTIGNDVDIGANTTIDRGALEDTIIEDGVKLDNLIQVGHNVKIGAHTIIAGCVAIAGSSVIGKHCMIGGATCIAGHLTIADKVIVTGMTAVSKSITNPGIYSSGVVGAVPNDEFRKNNARFHRLGNLMDKVKTLEATIKELTERSKS
ncbi:MAG: UDP-3-O-(3-hydroxymyristoyl)glucosamine N-acyltransferase [Gammaproteobacteria bacterium]